MRAAHAPIPPLLGLILLLGAACEPPAGSPTRMMVLLQESDGLFRPHQVELTTLTRPAALEGRAARMIGGAKVVLDNDDPELQHADTLAKVRNALVKDEGHPVRAQYIERTGVLWPADFHSWNLATAYYHFERAAQYFRDTGAVPESALDPALVYYFADLRFVQESPNPVVDNALWFPPVQALFLLPFDELQKVPLAINGGVLVHEYAHRVFNRRVYRGASLPDALAMWSNTTGGPTPGINVLRSLDEGFADFHAVAASCRTPFGCDTRFMNSSMGESVSNARDLAQESRMCLSRELINGLFNMNTNDFSARGFDYQLGSVLASSLWQAGQATGQRESLEQALLDAYTNDDPTRPGIAERIELALSDQSGFSLGIAMDAVVRHISDPTLQKAVCGELMDHARMGFEDLPSCPPTTVAGTTCEALP